MTACEMCGRKGRTTRHHLTPRKFHRRLKKRGADPAGLARTVDLCPTCHRAVHAAFREAELAREADSLEKILGHPRLNPEGWAGSSDSEA